MFKPKNFRMNNLKQLLISMLYTSQLLSYVKNVKEYHDRRIWASDKNALGILIEDNLIRWYWLSEGQPPVYITVMKGGREPIIKIMKALMRLIRTIPELFRTLTEDAKAIDSLLTGIQSDLLINYYEDINANLRKHGLSDFQKHVETAMNDHADYLLSMYVWLITRPEIGAQLVKPNESLTITFGTLRPKSRFYCESRVVLSRGSDLQFNVLIHWETISTTGTTIVYRDFDLDPWHSKHHACHALLENLLANEVHFTNI